MKKRVLVVDDDPDLLEGLRTLLEEQYVVLVASDGEEALDLIDREPVDALLLDMMMPRVNGEAVLRRLQRAAAAPPTIVISARADGKELARALGAVGFLAKPFDVDLLERTVARVLDGDGGGGPGPTQAPPTSSDPAPGGSPAPGGPDAPEVRALRAA